MRIVFFFGRFSRICEGDYLSEPYMMTLFKKHICSWLKIGGISAPENTDKVDFAGITRTALTLQICQHRKVG